ncbi:MAG: tryptophan--tRNA ligase [Deltaproteobacteria bacterium]|nr:tryptophan--tRNA ligase [Candidatus Anaeroferrophillus wilburensis]MBN2888301.1 tryptophan--tRNA ligase [Deltaproteobacteria bacterium]
MEKKRVLSGMRTTGKLHLGHFHGVLTNWLDFQEKYDCFFFAADWHALTSEFQHPEIIRESTRDMFIDWLSVGIDPQKATLFIQSQIKEHAELHLLLSMITPLSWLLRNPTFKDSQDEQKSDETATYGFLGYPVLQAADIIIYMANLVPIGVDQLPHVELTREITRRFNYLYGEIFPIPEPILTEVPKLMGLDGRKMSKSYQNAIFLADDEEAVRNKVSQMVTDIQRARRKDPGDPDVCNMFPLHPLYSSGEEVDRIRRECPRAAIGCVECKKILMQNLMRHLEPVQEKRRYYEVRPQLVDEIVADGIARSRSIAVATMEKVRDGMKI